MKLVMKDTCGRKENVFKAQFQGFQRFERIYDILSDEKIENLGFFIFKISFLLMGLMIKIY